jgi:CRP-like cAMP-binding protein
VSDLYNLTEFLLEQHGVSASLANDMAELLSTSWERQVEEGHTLCVEGQPSAEMWFLVSGGVQVLKRDFLGNEQPLAALHAPAVLGHMGLVNRTARSATVRALKPSVVRVVEAHRFDVLLSEISPAGDAFRRLLISSMMEQLTRGNRELGFLLHPEDAATVEDVSHEERLIRAEASFDGWKRD